MDGGNNDFSFYKPDLSIVVVDPHRAGHEVSYFPGMTNLIMADVLVINKEETATLEGIEKVRANIEKWKSKRNSDRCCVSFVRQKSFYYKRKEMPCY